MPIRRPSSSGIDRRTLLAGGLVGGLGGGAFLLAHGCDGQPLPAHGQGRPVGDALVEAYERLCQDLADAWWSPGGNTSDGLAGIRSTDGSGGWNTGRANFNDRPASVDNARGASFWQSAQYLRFLSNDRRLREGVLADAAGARAARTRILAQRRLWHTIYSAQELAGDGARDGTVNASDDAAWKLQALKAVHQATGAAEDLATLRAATIAILAHYADAFTPAHRRTIALDEGGDGLTFSVYGSLYALPGQDRNGQGRATTYEAGIMDAALYLARSSPRNAAFRTYAATVYGSFRATLQQASGIYFQTLQLDPARRYDGTAFLKPIDSGKAVPRQDYDGVTIGGTMGMAVIASDLFAQTGDDRYRRDVAHVVAGIAGNYLQHGCILCDHDPWSAGVWGHDFADRALRLPGVDPGGRVAAALAATAKRIVATRTPIDAHTGRRAYGYSAEWSGNAEHSVGESRTGADDGLVTWAANGAKANGGRGGGQAAANQIMTATSSGIMVQAAVQLGRGRES